MKSKLTLQRLRWKAQTLSLTRTLQSVSNTVIAAKAAIAIYEISDGTAVVRMFWEIPACAGMTFLLCRDDLVICVGMTL